MGITFSWVVLHGNLDEIRQSTSDSVPSFTLDVWNWMHSILRSRFSSAVVDEFSSTFVGEAQLRHDRTRKKMIIDKDKEIWQEVTAQSLSSPVPLFSSTPECQRWLALATEAKRSSTSNLSLAFKNDSHDVFWKLVEKENACWKRQEVRKCEKMCSNSKPFFLSICKEVCQQIRLPQYLHIQYRIHVYTIQSSAYAYTYYRSCLEIQLNQPREPFYVENVHC